MKNKLMFRILGALASALIIASVFIPFVSVSGYTQSLWETYKSTDIYLPIMIIVFGAIGVLSFSINIKTEFAYSTSGALLFYTITQTISVVNQDMLSSLGVGYYCLVVGAILTGIMAFLCNLRTKKAIEIKEPIKQNEEISMLNQIDKLYDEQNINTLEQSNNSLDNIIQPLPITNIQPVIQPQETQPQIVEQVQPLSNLGNIENNSVEQQSVTNPETIDVVNSTQQPQLNQQNQSPAPVSQEVAPSAPQIVEQPQPTVAQPLSNIGNVETNTANLQPVSIPQMVNSENNVPISNPVVAEFEVPTDNVLEQPQPFFASTSQNDVSTPAPVEPQVEQPNLFAVNENAIESNNPVVSEFTSQPNKIFSNQEVPAVNNINTPVANNSNLDIFN